MQGGLLFGKVHPDTSVKYNGRDLFVDNKGRFVLGFGRDEKKNITSLNPEIRIYNQPNILTSEVDIKTTIFLDKFIVINLIKGEETFNVRYQTKPFMIWIWISVCLISIGGMMGILKKN